MSATDELRRLLDKHGVEYKAWDGGTHPITAWYVDGQAFEFVEYRLINGAKQVSNNPWDNDGHCMLTITNRHCTPEQAVDATLGRGECRDLAETPKYGDKTRFECSACGYEYSSVGGFGCDYGDEPDFRYCPGCGREVVS